MNDKITDLFTMLVGSVELLGIVFFFTGSVVVTIFVASLILTFFYGKSIDAFQKKKNIECKHEVWEKDETVGARCCSCGKEMR